MNQDDTETGEKAHAEATAQLHEAAAAKKCWPCGCLHQSLQAIERSLHPFQRPPALEAALSAAHERLLPVQYDCLGCEVCYPALAVNALSQTAEHAHREVCPTEQVETRAGWPPLPGAYTVLRYQAPIAICTLTDDTMSAAIADQADNTASIIGTLQTENLGIERLIQNILANPHIRFLIVCGADSRQAIGHLPGQSLVALARHGLDERSRIVGARGKRPVIRNLSREAVEHFRQTVEVIDLVGAGEAQTVLVAVRECAERNPGPAQPFAADRQVAPSQGYLPSRMTPDPAGYFVIDVNRLSRRLSLEHYQNSGVLDRVIVGASAAELYTPAIEEGLLSRLDHAAYLGRELARAEEARRLGKPFVQDAAPEQQYPAQMENSS